MLRHLDISYVIVSHEYDFLAGTTQKIYSMNPGQIVFDGDSSIPHSHLHSHPGAEHLPPAIPALHPGSIWSTRVRTSEVRALPPALQRIAQWQEDINPSAELKKMTRRNFLTANGRSTISIYSRMQWEAALDGEKPGACTTTGSSKM